MKFSYTALGTDNQKLTGTLNAGSSELAREELHKMGLSVIALNEIKAQNNTTGPQIIVKNTPSDILTYYFSATDPQGKLVNGTIDAKDPYSAYRRLISEYQFQVQDLAIYQANETSGPSFKNEFENWNLGLRQEGIDPTPKKIMRNELEDEGEKMAEEIVTEIDHFILNTKKILTAHQHQYSKAFLQEIENTLGRLERIRASNNLKHITKVCNDLYELVSHPDLLENSTENQEYEQIIGSLRESGFVENKFNFLEKQNLEQKAERFSKIKSIFSGIQSKLGKTTRALEKNLEQKKSFLKDPPIKSTSPAENSLKSVSFYLWQYIKETNPILRRARKQDLVKSYHDWKQSRTEKKELPANSQIIPVNTEKNDFTGFFMELDSFFGWLLFFYLTYFYLISFSLERDIGLPKALVLKTLTSPLIINVCIFLIVFHLALKLKIRLFKGNVMGSFFLFSLFLGGYAILIANF